jgi:hypothetical protein
MAKHFVICILLCSTLLNCSSQNIESENNLGELAVEAESDKSIQYDTTVKTIHVFVALCDNKYQGIVPVPSKIGNGQDPNNNLYWGCGFGIRTFFKNSKEWKLIRATKLDSVRLERLVFESTTENYYLIADAYDGKYIEQCTKDFLSSSSGKYKDILQVNETIIGLAGNSKLIAYIGHDGLMDFQINETYQNTDNKKRDVIILACYSKRFFSPHLQKANVNPLVWTSGLMCPEAYTIHDAISGYLKNETNEQIRTRAALAYSKYQKCSEKASRNLLQTSW